MSHDDDDDRRNDDDPCDSTAGFNAAGWGFDPWRDAAGQRRSWAQDERWTGDEGPSRPLEEASGGTLRVDGAEVLSAIAEQRAPELDADWADGTLRIADAAQAVGAFGAAAGTAEAPREPTGGASYEAGRLRRGARGAGRGGYRSERPQREATPGSPGALEATVALRDLPSFEPTGGCVPDGLPERHLMVFDARGRATPLPLELERFVIGRGMSHQLVLADAHCDREHAELVVTRERVEIVDLDSAHGTFVNACPIKRAVWRPGDVVRIGEHRLALVIGPVERRHYTLSECHEPPEMLELPRRPGLLRRLFKRGS